MHTRLYVALAVFVGLAVAGCSGTSVTPGPSLTNPALRSVASGRVKADKASYKRALYVADTVSNSVKILSNTYYRELGVITNGIAGPLGESIDRQGNLYIANAGGDVTEYAPGGTSPSFTYSASLTIPFSVVVDRHGSVYVANEGMYGGGSINEYFQGFNSVAKSCPVPRGDPQGVAVDAHSDVFVSVGFGIYEFSGGLSNCTPTFLSALQYTPISQLAVDSNSDLIVGAGLYYSAYVIAPPYSTVTRTIGSQGNIYGVSLSKKNKLLFAAYPSVYGGYVLVYNYQTGELITTLGLSYGISNATVAVDAPNAVY